MKSKYWLIKKVKSCCPTCREEGIQEGHFNCISPENPNAFWEVCSGEPFYNGEEWLEVCWILKNPLRTISVPWRLKEAIQELPEDLRPIFVSKLRRLVGNIESILG